jgi:hypothetical protein
MKASRFILIASALVVSSSFAVAGPGPQYWQNRSRQEKKDQVQESKQATTATTSKANSKAQAASNCQGCSECNKSM